MNRYLLPFVLLLAALLALLAACGDDSDNGGGANGDDDGGIPTSLDGAGVPSPAIDRSDMPFKIVVSLPIFGEFARLMAGDHAEVTVLIPPGEDPHTYVPDDSLAAKVEEADMVFYNGLGLEPQTQAFIEQHLPDRRQFVIDFVRNVPSPTTEQPVDRPIYAKDVGDEPHLFLDPLLATIYPETVSDSLVIKDSGNKGYYLGRYEAYEALLEALDAEIATALAAIEPRPIVTYHNSLTHFASHFGLTVAGTLADDGEEALEQAIASGEVAAVFTEEGYPEDELREIAEQGGVPVCHLYTDTIEDEERTYLEMMRANAEALVECLRDPS